MADTNTILAESSLFNALYGEIGQAATARANAAALTTEAGGQLAEAGQYDIATAISNQNAAIAQISGTIQQYQTSRQLLRTVGQQRSGYASGGFMDSGTAMDVARSSLQQGVLQNQITGLNASLEAGGYFAQAAASAAEATTARTASATSTTNATNATNLANLSNNSAVATGNFINSIPGAGGILSQVPGASQILAGIPGMPNLAANNTGPSLGNATEGTLLAQGWTRDSRGALMPPSGGPVHHTVI